MAAELLQEFESKIVELILVPSEGGCFEISVNEHLIYSKLQTSRHAEPGEVLELLRRHIQAPA